MPSITVSWRIDRVVAKKNLQGFNALPLSKERIPDTFSTLLFVAIFIVSICGGMTAAGWGWDFANGLGFAAIAGLVYMCVQSAARVPVPYHQAFGYIVLLLIVAHALWFLIADRVVLEYLKPGAPAYMWAGLLSFALILLLVLSAHSTARQWAFRSRPGFRRWHRALSWVAISAALLHTLGSGLYIRNVVQYFLLALLILPVLMPTLLVKHIGVRGYSAFCFLSLGLCLASVVSFSRNVWQL